jgi:hypothetical protein
LVGISERVLRLAQKGGWIGVDLDGTMFTYHGWVGWNVFGEPIVPMIERVRVWHAAGVGVRIVTARVGLPVTVNGKLALDHRERSICKVTGERFSDRMMVGAIQDKLESVRLPRLPVQCFKDVDMIELWDDRAIQVIANTGRTLADEHQALSEALRGKQYGMNQEGGAHETPATGA